MRTFLVTYCNHAGIDSEHELTGSYDDLLDFITQVEGRGGSFVLATEADDNAVRVAYENGALTEWAIIGRACDRTTPAMDPDSPNYGGY